MDKKNITGIQQIGVGVADVHVAWKWYRQYFGIDIGVFEEEAVAEEEAAAKAEEEAAAKSQKTQWWVKASPKMRNSMTDPDSGVRIGVNQTPLGADLPREGSWLDCQIKAGLVVILKGPVL